VRARVPERAAADAAKAAAAGRDLRVQHVGGLVADPQVDGADDSRRDPGLAVGARRAHGGDAVDELGLPDAAIGFQSVRLEHGAAFDEHGRHHVVPAGEVVEDFVEQVALLLAFVPLVPQVMVRIADRQLGLERRFVHFRQPVLVLRRRAHGVLPGSF
jgi:hypothetical protein